MTAGRALSTSSAVFRNCCRSRQAMGIRSRQSMGIIRVSEARHVRDGHRVPAHGEDEPVEQRPETRAASVASASSTATRGAVAETRVAGHGRRDAHRRRGLSASALTPTSPPFRTVDLSWWVTEAGGATARRKAMSLRSRLGGQALPRRPTVA